MTGAPVIVKFRVNRGVLELSHDTLMDQTPKFEAAEDPLM
jgi:hypothetical protein